MGGGKETQTQQTTYDPAYMARINDNYDHAKSIADLPFQPFGKSRVADFSPLQQQGQQGLLAAANDPTSAGMLNTAQGGIFSALNSVGTLGGYQPRTVSAPTLNMQKLSDVDYSKYESPYINDVVNTTLADLSQARDRQRLADGDAATAAHAFGGSRQGVADSLTNEAYLRNVASTTANLRQGAFQNAQQAALSDINQQNTVGMFNIGNNMTAQTTNAANDIAGAGLRLNAANAQGSLSAQLANMSQQQLQQALQRAGVIEGVGAEQSAHTQAGIDADYEEFLRQLNYPYQQQALRNSALGMFPVESTTTNTKTKDSGVGGIFSALLAGGQTAGALGWAPFSDERTKENVRTEHFDGKGRRWVSFNYKWDDPSERKQGVIAQEIARTDPHAVMADPETGYLRVDYSKLEAA